MQYYLVTSDPDAYDFLKILSKNSLEVLNSISGEKLVDKWSPIPVDLVKMKSRGDFPSMSGVVTFSEKAFQVLEPVIRNSVEFLPLICKEGFFYAVNILEKATLDLEKAEVKRLSDGEIIRIKKYSFKNETVIGKHIFTPEELPYSSPIVSDVFKEVVEKSKLEGLIFKKAWEMREE